jgi:hypothetical protein
MLDVNEMAASCSRNAAIADERHSRDLRRFEFSSLRRLFARPQIPPWRLVSARGALERHAPSLEVQECVMSVETAEELPNLIGNHCPETPFQLLDRYDACWHLLGCRPASTANPTLQDKCHAWGAIRKPLLLNGLTIRSEESYMARLYLSIKQVMGSDGIPLASV